MQSVVASTGECGPYTCLSPSTFLFLKKSIFFELGVLCVSIVANFLILLVRCNPYFARGAN
jgi:hypothetical protein